MISFFAPGFVRSIALVLVFLLAWGALKVGWEQSIARRAQLLRYHGEAAMTPTLGDQLGQGAFLAVLGGLRAVVANYFWLEVTDAWQRKEWFRLKTLIDLVTTLQPRSTLFWELGGWHLAWNASVDKRYNMAEKSEARRILDERFWIEQGRQFFLRGAENIPDRYNMWFQLGFLEAQKLHDPLASAHYYQEALKRPGAPQYLQRFVGYDLEKGGDFQGAYAWWRQLWLSTSDHSARSMAWDKVEEHLRKLEDQLQIPPEKRIFPPSRDR